MEVDKAALHKIKTDIERYLNNNNQLVETSASDTINIRGFELRENYINELSIISSQLHEITTNVDNCINKAKNLRSKELLMMDSLMKKRNPYSNFSNLPTNTPLLAPAATFKPQAGIIHSPLFSTSPPPKTAETNPWTTVVRKKPIANAPKTYSEVLIPTDEPVLIPEVQKLTKINLTDSLSLKAICVGSFDQVKQDGNLYYIESADHFAFNLAGNLIHGNIGTIYTDEKNPEKIKDCKFGAECIKRAKCDYYHDPKLYPGSRDHRNFIASSWLYAPPDSQYKNKSRSRRFGSREHLDFDIVNLSEEERDRYASMLCHDVLCTLIINAAFSKSNL
jgi:hypothetical protein